MEILLKSLYTNPTTHILGCHSSMMTNGRRNAVQMIDNTKELNLKIANKPTSSNVLFLTTEDSSISIPFDLSNFMDLLKKVDIVDGKISKPVQFVLNSDYNSTKSFSLKLSSEIQDPKSGVIHAKNDVTVLKDEGCEANLIMNRMNQVTEYLGKHTVLSVYNRGGGLIRCTASHKANFLKTLNTNMINEESVDMETYNLGIKVDDQKSRFDCFAELFNNPDLQSSKVCPVDDNYIITREVIPQTCNVRHLGTYVAGDITYDDYPRTTDVKIKSPISSSQQQLFFIRSGGLKKVLPIL